MNATSSARPPCRMLPTMRSGSGKHSSEREPQPRGAIIEMSVGREFKS